MTMDIATLGIRVDATEARLAAVELDRLSASGNRTTSSMSAVERATKLLAGAFVGLSAVELAKQIIGVNREFETLRTSLITTTGSIEKAGLAFKFIQDFAAKTPFDVQQVTESFIKLGNLGLKPSEAALRSYGNTAAAQAKPIMQMIEAVADAATGEFERLKEFGIKAKVHGDNVGFVFQGVTTEVKNNAQAIEGYLINLGNTKFGDSMANQSKTINGSISTLSDTWSTFMDNLLNDAKENMIAKWVQTAGNALHWLDIQMNGAIRSADKLAEVDARIAANKAALNAHDKNGAVGSLVDGLAGYDPSLVKNRIDADIKLRAELTKTIGDEKKAQDALIATMGVSGATQDKTTEAKKAAEKAAKAAAKAQEALAKSFADTLSGLSLHNIELSKTTREHKEAELSAKGYTQAMVAQAMALYDIGTALEAKKKLHEDEKSELDSLIDKYNQLTLSARDYKLTQLNAQGITGSDQTPIMAQFDKNAGAEVAKKATDDATASLDAYNKKLDDANTKTSDLGAVTSAIFDGALAGINGMAGAFDSMVNSIASSTKALEENAAMQKANESEKDPDKQAANSKKYATEEINLNNKVLTDKLKAGSQIAGFLSSSLKKGSTEQRAAHAIQMGLAGAELAMNVAKMMGIDLLTMKEIASTGPVVAASTAKGTAKASEAVATQATAGPYIGFALMAAMVVAMAAIGFATGGGGGGAASGPPPSNSDMGTGTVLGDPTAKSESIKNTNDLLQSIHADEYVELRGINKGVQALSGSILSAITKQFQLGAIQGVNAPNLGKSGHTMVAGGLQTGAISLGDLLKGNNVFGQMYTTDAKKGGTKEKPTYEYTDYLSPMAAELQKSLTDVFKNIGTTFKELSTKLGPEFSKKINAAIVPALKIDTMGLSGKDAVEKANAVISSTLDKVSAVVFSSLLKYQQLGEGMYETAVRIDAEKAIIKDAFAQSGKAMPKVATDAIAMADALVQASGGIEKFQASFAAFMDKFTTDPEKQTRTRKYLQGAFRENNLFNGKQIGSMLNSRDAYGNAVDAAAADVAKYAGKKGAKNIAAEKTAVDKYSLLLEMAPKVDEFISYNEKVTKDTLDMDIKLAQSRGDGLEVSKLVLKSHEAELKLLPEKLRITQQLIWNQETANKQASLDITLMKAQGRTVEALAISRQKELDAMEPSLQTTQRQINAMDDLNTAMTASTKNVSTAISRLTSLSDKLKSTMSSIKVETNESLKADRANARALLGSALIIAKAGGAIDNIAGMDKALTDIAKPSEQLYATFTDYARDQQGTASTISQLAGYADAQVSMAQKQLDAINKTTTAVEVSLPAALAELMGLAAQKNFVGPMPQFASGGYHSGGWRVVGENGPEIEQTGASRIFSNGQSKGLLSTDELVAELQALRAEVRAGQEAIANNTRQTAKILRDVTQDGQSITTSAVVA